MGGSDVVKISSKPMRSERQQHARDDAGFGGLAANGEQGVTDVLEILNQETKDTLSLVGQRNLRDVGAHNLYRS